MPTEELHLIDRLVRPGVPQFGGRSAVSSTMGTRSAEVSTIAGKLFASAEPDVVTQHAGRPVARAYPSAAKLSPARRNGSCAWRGVFRRWRPQAASSATPREKTIDAAAHEFLDDEIGPELVNI
ncbi:MAG: hypothetical protein R2834_04285 [Rhodothermales bacterium]